MSLCVCTKRDVYLRNRDGYHRKRAVRGLCVAESCHAESCHAESCHMHLIEFVIFICHRLRDSWITRMRRVICECILCVYSTSELHSYMTRDTTRGIHAQNTLADYTTHGNTRELHMWITRIDYTLHSWITRDTTRKFHAQNTLIVYKWLWITLIDKWIRLRITLMDYT